MRILFLSPGAGKMYCGNCFRDNALVRSLRGLGHDALMAPLYLPLTLDEKDQSEGTPIFYGGINVYLDQKSRLFAWAPHWLRQRLSSPKVLAWAAGRAAKTRPAEVGDLTLSMLQGREGRQARELDELTEWLKADIRPEVVVLSNALLLGLGPRLKTELGCRIVCLLAGEDSFLDALPAPYREDCWRTAARQAAHVDQFHSPSVYYAGLMGRRLGLAPDRMAVVPPGISLEGYEPPGEPPPPPGGGPVLGFFARMCRDKGLPALVEAFIALRKTGRHPNLTLRVGGSCGPSDQVVVEEMRGRLREHGLDHAVSFHPNLDRPAKLAFLRSLTIFSVPALYGEAFGLYLLEAMAAGVPVVQPPCAAFPEVVARTGGGLLSTDNSPGALAAAIESLLQDPARARALGDAGRRSVFDAFSDRHMAENTLRALAPTTG